MIHLPASVRVYLCLKPCDMRKGAIHCYVELPAYGSRIRLV